MAGFITVADAALALTGDDDNTVAEAWLALLARQVDAGALHGVVPGGATCRLLAWESWRSQRDHAMDWLVPMAAFDAWCKHHGYEPTTVAPPERKSPRGPQIAGILAAARDQGYDPMDIPRGGKEKIKVVCLGNARLFVSDNAFEHAWKAARVQGKVMVENHEWYARRN